MIFHHVGIGVLDLEPAIKIYESIDHVLKVQVDDPGINVRVAFMSPLQGGPWIELLAPLNAGGPLESLIKRKILPAPYHTCYGVEDLDAAIPAQRARGFLLLGKPQPAIAFDNRRVAFFYHAMIGLIELVERPPQWQRGGAASA